jgi:DNA-binding CsgD family transcriptional regulator
MIGRMQRSMPDVVKLVLTGFDGLASIRELGPRLGFGDIRKTPLVGDYFKKHGLEDYSALQTLEPGGRGIVIAAGQSERRTFDRRTRKLWQQISAHIAAGRRLREAIVYSRPLDEVILKPSGKVEHAEGEGASSSARSALQDAVTRIEKARGKQRRSDPDGATEAWTAMVSGRWSLVDRFERGGRRYVVARRNEHALRDPRALTSRERVIVHLAALGKSNKLIGYELGLAESTIGSHLSTAMRKLGVNSRVDLLRLVLAFGPPET